MAPDTEWLVAAGFWPDRHGSLHFGGNGPFSVVRFAADRWAVDTGCCIEDIPAPRTRDDVRALARLLFGKELKDVTPTPPGPASATPP